MVINPKIEGDLADALKDAPDGIREKFMELDPGLREVMADLWVKSRDPERREEHRRTEQEARARQLERLKDQSGIPEKYAKGFDVLVTNAANRNAIWECMAYVKKWRPRGEGLALFGDVGVGKTQLACTVGLRLIEHELIDVRYANVVHAFELARMSFESGKGNPIPAMITCDFLILDDLGAQKSTPWTMEQVLLITDYRTMRDLPMLVTSNAHSWKELAGMLAGPRSGADPVAVARIIDRLREALARPVVMRGKSWRKTGV